MELLTRRCIVSPLKKNNYIFLCLGRNYMDLSFHSYKLLLLLYLCPGANNGISSLCLIIFYTFKDCYAVALVNFCLHTWRLCT